MTETARAGDNPSTDEIAVEGETDSAGRARNPLGSLGPGLITGASDDDPTGIATYSQAGAQFGYDLGWTLLFSWPLMCAIQEISARIGRVTGRGIAGNLKAALSGRSSTAWSALLVVANTINLGRRPRRHGRGAEAA